MQSVWVSKWWRWCVPWSWGICAMLLALASATALAEEPAISVPPATSPSDKILEDELITATLLPEDPHDLPYSISEAPSLRTPYVRSPRTLGEAFHDQPSVLPQKTAPGQFSPFLRGFTGFRTLVLVDGLRLNNSVFREGPNQYAAFIDPLLVERAEVSLGPSSVLYGSDAVGGTLQFFTRGAEPTPQADAGSRLVQRYSGAENSSVTRLEGYASGPSMALFAGGAWRDYDDIRGGRHNSTFDNTSYVEWNNDAKLHSILTEEWDLIVDYQRHEQKDAPRTHSTVDAVSYRGTAVGTDLRRDLSGVRELFYTRLLTEESGEEGQGGAFTAYRYLLTEDEERTQSNSRYSKQGFTDALYGLTGFWATPTAIGRLTFGADYTWEDVDSDFIQFNADGSLNVKRPRGPVADQSFYQQLGVYVQDEVAVSERVTLTGGARFNVSVVDAHDVDPDPSDAAVFESIHETYEAVVGNVRALYAATENVNFYAGAAQAFRAPNLSDLTRYDNARSNEFEIPAPGLHPEKYLTLEGGTKVRGEHFEVAAGYYYTFVKDQIIRYPTGSVDANGNTIVTKENVGDGHAEGVEVSALAPLVDGWELYGGFNWFLGEVSTLLAPGVEDTEPMSRSAPATGVAGIRWRSADARVTVEADVRMVAEADRLSPDDLRDTQRIPPGGTPGYSVVGVRGNWRVNEWLSLFAAAENLTDRDYRIHGSGTNEPGANVIVGTEIRF